MKQRFIYEIAKDIEADFKSAERKDGYDLPHARPYLDAMHFLKTVDQMYLQESAASMIIYFLSNATMWRGGRAPELKMELRNLIS